MMTFLRVILVCAAFISVLGAIASKPEEKRDYHILLGISGCLFIVADVVASIFGG